MGTSAIRVLGITLGDVTGIGPEVAIKAIAGSTEPDTALVLIGDEGVIRRTSAVVGWSGAFHPWLGREQASPGVWWCRPEGAELPDRLPAGDARAAVAAVKALKMAAQMGLHGDIDGVVTAPVNKEAILRTGQPFIGQTELITELAGGPSTGMMLLGTDAWGRWLRVLLATTHLPLRRVPAAITRDGLRESLKLADRACRELNLERRRIAVCGLNPHAGEGGYLGNEELEIIGPAVREAQESGLDVSGPWAADTLFQRAIRGEFEVVLAQYHDQGLAPLKLVAFETGVNWTVGMPFVRTSPDHGTAYEIAGRGVADPSSMRAALRLAIQLTGNKPVAEGSPEPMKKAFPIPDIAGNVSLFGT